MPGEECCCIAHPDDRGQRVERVRAIEVGCCAFVEKPIDVTTFTDRIEEIAGSRH
jgi:DNA-binding response OmpR family regulator